MPIVHAQIVLLEAQVQPACSPNNQQGVVLTDLYATTSRLLSMCEVHAMTSQQLHLSVETNPTYDLLQKQV